MPHRYDELITPLNHQNMIFNATQSRNWNNFIKQPLKRFKLCTNINTRSSLLSKHQVKILKNNNSPRRVILSEPSILYKYFVWCGLMKYCSDYPSDPLTSPCLFYYESSKSSSNVIVLALAGQIKWIYLYQIKVYHQKKLNWILNVQHSVHYFYQVVHYKSLISVSCSLQHHLQSNIFLSWTHWVMIG